MILFPGDRNSQFRLISFTYALFVNIWRWRRGCGSRELDAWVTEWILRRRLAFVTDYDDESVNERRWELLHFTFSTRLVLRQVPILRQSHSLASFRAQNFKFQLLLAAKIPINPRFPVPTSHLTGMTR